MSYIQDFVHETDSGIVSSLFPEDEFSDLNELGDKDQTYGGHVDLRFPPLPVQDLIIRAWTTVATVKDDTTANECRRILQIIAESILFFQTQGFDLGHLPRLHTFDLEDGSLLIEWIFDDFRIGFGVEPTPSESSWYLVSNARLENINQAGDIPQNELETQDLMLRLVNFVVSNS